MLEIKVKRDPYVSKKYLYKTSSITLKEGLNVIIGRNGSGKSTFFKMAKDYCDKMCISTYSYDDYSEGNTSSMQGYMFFGDFESFASTAFHSEGEQIFYNFGKNIEKVGKFIRENSGVKQLVILFDAIDSGLDVDGIEQLKGICEVITKDCKAKGTEVYIIVTANNYALIHKSHCIDVRTGKEYYFENYEDFKNYILDQYKADRSKK